MFHQNLHLILNKVEAHGHNLLNYRFMVISSFIRRKKKELPEQTDPPSIPIVELFPSGKFPEGEIQQYKVTYGGLHLTKRELERLEKPIYNSVHRAAEVHRQVRKYIKGHIVDCAFTVAFNPMFDPLLEASREATNTGTRQRHACPRSEFSPKSQNQKKKKKQQQQQLCT
ncbi:hypothetical protein HYC85_003738 [Camellia sinensis]|uniref:Uncharacterized protein n=1 Tax=Camellia sinensis TaxID=4442 RepID=A0A7J7HUI5_CAMSI|nr:hypothetical protein HYC85_003738 [Camellia sinensis]